MDNKKNNKNVYIIMSVCIEILVFFVSCHMGIYKKFHNSSSFLNVFSGGIQHLKSSPLSIFPIHSSTWLYFMAISAVGAVIVFAAINRQRSREVTMRGKEGGSASWNTDIRKYNKKYTDPKGSPNSSLFPSNNMILSDEVFLSMDTRQTRQNNNVLVVGGSGSGKSRFFIKPNILQANACYVCTDPSGELLAATGKFLEEREHYKIKIFNLMQMQKSHRYNPFKYLHEGKDEEILTMIDCLIENTTTGNKSEDFWVNSEKLLYRALCFYVMEKGTPEDRNWSTIMFLLRQASVDEDHAERESTLDVLFRELEEEHPTSIAVSQYKSFKQGAGKTLKSILISCCVRLAVFDIEQLAHLTNKDDMELDKLGHEKMAYFVITPQTTKTFNFLVAMLYSQMFQVLYEEGNRLLEEGKAFQYPIRFMLDEFVNVGKIPEFDVKIATMRKYGLSSTVVLQNIDQLEAAYDKAVGKTISDNCDTFVYLGGISLETAKYVADLMGKQTIRTGNVSHSSGKSSYSESFSQQGRELMTPDEIIRMPKSHCIVIPAGQKPFYTPKFNYGPRHPNYQYTGDAKEANLYLNTLDNMQTSDEDIKKNEKKTKSAFEIECEIREVIKNSDEEFKIASLPDFINAYKNNNVTDIFEEMSDVNLESTLTEKETARISNEMARVILTNIQEGEAKAIIRKYKEKTIQNSASSSGSLLNIIDEIKNSASISPDEFTKIFYN